jgi:ribosomal protein L31E
MNFNELTKHIRQLNELEQVKHHQRATEAIQRIKELCRKARSQQETSASADTSGTVR